MNPSPVRKVVIAGRDASAWLAANAMIRAFGPGGLSVEVVELPSLLRPQDVFMSLPALEAFHRLLGFDEYDLLKACSGTYSLGQSFANFSGPLPPFLHPYGSHGAPLGKVAFHQLWIKAKQAGMNVAFEDFSLTAAAAKQGRFFTTNNEISAFARCDYAYHLRAIPYVHYLKAHALRRGVTVTATRHVQPALDAESGHIRSLTLADASTVAGDLFIDATGTDSLLLGQGLGVGFESWSQWFPCDRVMTAGADRLRSLPPFSQVRALEAGCLHLAPVQDMTGVIHAYSSDYASDDEAFKDLAVTAGLPVHPDATVNPLKPGCRVTPWAKNCIGVGEAAAVFDPIDSPGLHSIQFGLAHLIALFPADTACALEAEEYNRNVHRAIDGVRDYQITHYKLNRLHDRPFWDAARAMTAPESLAYKLDLFAARGVIALYDEETFQADDWLSSYIGHGLMPRAYDPLVDMTSQEDGVRHVQRMLAFIRQQVNDMSSHDAYLELFAARDFA